MSASFPLLNKYALIWSIFVISVNGSYILQTNSQSPVAQHSLNWSAAGCFHAVTLPCPANWLTVSQPVTTWKADNVESLSS